MEPLDELDVKDMVIYKKVSQDVIGVREFNIAKALLEGQKEFSHAITSKWGPVTIFDPCHYDTALAVVRQGGSYAKGQKVKCQRGRRAQTCRCRTKKTCEHRCFGWPVDKGTWMGAWDVHLWRCSRRGGCRMPFLQGLLALSRSGAELHFMSTEGMTGLLDIAILGTRKLQRMCQGTVRFGLYAAGLERICSKRLQKISQNIQRSCSPQSGGCGLRACPGEGGMHGELGMQGDMPLRVALFLQLEIRQWQQLEEFFPPGEMEAMDLQRFRSLFPLPGW